MFSKQFFQVAAPSELECCNITRLQLVNDCVCELRVVVPLAGADYQENTNVACQRGGPGTGIRKLVTPVRHQLFSVRVPGASGRSLKLARWRRQSGV